MVVTRFNKRTKKPIAIFSGPLDHVDDDETGTIEGAWDDRWLIDNSNPKKPRAVPAPPPPPLEENWLQKRVRMYGDVNSQLAMLYDDMVAGTTKWKDHIASVKQAVPKPEDPKPVKKTARGVTLKRPAVATKRQRRKSVRG